MASPLLIKCAAISLGALTLAGASALAAPTPTPAISPNSSPLAPIEVPLHAPEPAPSTASVPPAETNSVATPQPPATTATAGPGAEPSVQPPAPLAPGAEEMKEASAAFSRGEWEMALKHVDAAIRFDPKNPAVYELRASFYVDHKLWDRANTDYLTAQKLGPSPLVSYDLGEVSFMSRNYDDARPKFAALEKDPQFGAVSSYKAYLCDLLGRHEQAATNDLALIDRNPDGPAYFFSHAVWDLYHGDRREGSNWLHKASLSCTTQVFQFYMLSLSESARVTPSNMNFTAKDGTAYKGVSGFVEEDGLRIAYNNKWETIPFENLPDDTSVLPTEIQQDIRENLIANTGSPLPDWVTFTTKDGRTFTHALATDEDDGLLVKTDHGASVIPYDQVPPLMGGFPPDLKARIAARFHFEESGHSVWSLVSFTTQDGRYYDQVRAMVDENGVNVITSDGWVTVPFSGLKPDLSDFSPQVKDQIKRQLANHPAMMGALKGGEEYLQARVTFTTTKGVGYDGVRYCVADDGVFVLTSDGWLVVPFAELPKDLSSFPDRAQDLIKLKEAEYLAHLKNRKHGDSP